MVEPVDAKQHEIFQKEAEQLDYNRNEFTFQQAVNVNHDTSIADVVMITRGELRRDYPHGGDSRWLGEALKDLYSGAFGEPEYARSLNQPAMLSEGPLKGKWMANAWFRRSDGTRVEFAPPDRIFESEVEAFRAAREWIRNERSRT